MSPALLALALAEDDSGWEPPCAPLEVFETVPRLHTEASPVDLMPMVVMRDPRPCAPAETFTLDFYRRAPDADPTLLQSLTLDTAEGPPTTLLQLPLDAALEPGGLYRLRLSRVEAEGVDALVQVDLVAGEATATGAAAPPAAPGLDLAWSYRQAGGGYRVLVGGTVLPSPDPDELSIVQLVGEGGEVVDTAPAYGAQPAGVSGWWSQDARPREVCLRAWQIDGAGRVGPASEPGCVTVARGDCEGCAGGGRRGAAAGWLLALLASIARRGMLAAPTEARERP